MDPSPVCAEADATEGEQVSVLIADDHPVYRSGLRILLGSVPPLHVIGEASSGEEVLAMAHELRPQLVLMDVSLPDMTGIEATKALANRHPDIAVIIVTMLDDRETFLAAMRAGARGFLLKGSSSDEVALAIKMVRSGGLAFDSHASTWVIDHLTKPQATAEPFPELTDREREILTLVADGHGNAAIARTLGLSIKTVRNYLSRIFLKLRLVDRTEAAVRARRAGLGH
jgi:DNA-binding NarL/FixJ family response regulator